jgi:hypothetical protein
MKTLLKFAACAAVLAAVAACGEQRGADGLTSEERQKLDDYAAEQDKNGVIDTSPDGLAVNGADEWTAAESGEGVVEGNGASPNANGL